MCCLKRNTLKTILHLICQLLWVVGLVLAMGGIYLLMTHRHYSLFFSQNYIILSAVFTLCSAAFLLCTGFLGTWLSLKDSRCLQGLFVYLLVVIFCLGSTASALAYVHFRKMGSETASLSEVFEKYTGSSQDINSQTVDATQKELQCCGVSNYTDWLDTSWFNHTGGKLFPRSCCNSTFVSCTGSVNQYWQLYSEGCQIKVEETFKFILSFIMWSCLLGFLTELVLLTTMGRMMMMEQQPFKYHPLHYS
ncbi:PREDICTED: tetraspanin-3-like [Cyprinodon variegatus]|uniref:Tetraspanin n=1 Tax=Cyprinodon variegatus TaxID=28743 RepID=A0A3Q2D7A7_CYPVA|nr:PREDICTED: tetraspanin-3-like [Cyprinodon variegatus]